MIILLFIFLLSYNDIDCYITSYYFILNLLIKNIKYLNHIMPKNELIYNDINELDKIQNMLEKKFNIEKYQSVNNLDKKNCMVDSYDDNILVIFTELLNHKHRDILIFKDVPKSDINYDKFIKYNILCNKIFLDIYDSDIFNYTLLLTKIINNN
jgi:hypothetical protein